MRSLADIAIKSNDTHLFSSHYFTYPRTSTKASNRSTYMTNLNSGQAPLYITFTIPKYMYNYDTESPESTGAHQKSVEVLQLIGDVY